MSAIERSGDEDDAIAEDGAPEEDGQNVDLEGFVVGVLGQVADVMDHGETVGADGDDTYEPGDDSDFQCGLNFERHIVTPTPLVPGSGGLNSGHH